MLFFVDVPKQRVRESIITTVTTSKIANATKHRYTPKLKIKNKITV